MHPADAGGGDVSVARRPSRRTDELRIEPGPQKLPPPDRLRQGFGIGHTVDMVRIGLDLFLGEGLAGQRPKRDGMQGANFGQVVRANRPDVGGSGDLVRHSMRPGVAVTLPPDRPTSS